MDRMLWGWTIALGLVLARIGYGELEAADAAVPEWTVLLLLTGGLLIGLIGCTGLCGMLGWLPPLGHKRV